MKQKFTVLGMTCSNCSALIKKTLITTNGVKDCFISVLSKEMEVDFDESLLTVKDIVRIVNSLGYKATTNKNQSIISNNLNKLIVSIVLLVGLFYLANYNMFHFPLLELFKNFYINSLTQLILAITIIIINFKFYKSGFMGILKKAPNMDTLIMLSSFSAVTYGIIIIILNVFNINESYNMLYFESGAMVIVLVSIGKYLESIAIDKTTKSIKDLVKYLPLKAVRLIGDNTKVEELINIDDIKVNDVLLVKEGNVIPSDGIVLDGNATVDESVLTGESGYLSKKFNDYIYKATVVKEGYLIIKAVKNGNNSMYDEIIELVNNSCVTKAKIGRIADKICQYFVPMIVILSIITFIIWMFISHDINKSFSLMITVLVISCPCALGLATPVSITCATGKAYKYYCLVKEASTFETLTLVKYALFDKTGTITKGEMEIMNVIPYKVDRNEFLNILCSIEKLSNHPYAKIISKIDTSITYQVTNFISLPTKGIKGVINDKIVMCGNKEFLQEHDILIPNFDYPNNTIYLSYDNIYFGCVTFSDVIKEESFKAIEAFKKIGIKTILISGDSLERTKEVANEVGFDEYYGKVLPKDKNDILNEYKKNGYTLFVGDGVNDSIAITNANVSFAINNSIDITKDNADVILKRNNLLDAYNLVELSKLTLRIVKENLFWAFIYNIILIPIAMGALSVFDIYMKPSYGAIAMCLSSLFVVMNALRINLYKYKNFNYGDKHMLIINVPKMMCSHCQERIKNALNKIEGLEFEIVLENKQVIIKSDNIDKKIICNAIHNAGYETKIAKK